MISLYAKGLTTGEIQAHSAEIYDTSASRETTSETTGEIAADMAVRQNRPLEPVYAVLLIDAITVKVRDSQVANRPVHVATGVDLAAERDVLALWLGPVGGEDAKHQAAMLGELRNRGPADALIVCCDGLKGPARSRSSPPSCAERSTPPTPQTASTPDPQQRCATEGTHPNEQATLKTLYPAATAKHNNRTNLTAKTNSRKTTPNTPTIHHGDRTADHTKRKTPHPITQKN